MEPNKITSSEDGWNSDNPAFPGMSCNDAARYLTVFTAAFRALIEADSKGSTLGVIQTVERLMISQRELIEGSDDYSDERALLGLSAIGLAMANMFKTDPRILGELTNQALASLQEVVKEKGVDAVNDSFAQFYVDKSETSTDKDAANGIARIKIAIALVPHQEFMDRVEQHEKKESPGLGNKIIRLLKGKPNA